MIFDLQGAVFPADNEIHNAVFAINNAGYVAGVYTEHASGGGSRQLGFVVKADAPNATKVFTPVDCAALNATVVNVRGINGHRDIVGRYDDATGTHGYVSLDAPNYGKCVDIPIPGAERVVVGGINDSRQIVGDFLVNKKRYGFLGRVDSSGQFSGFAQVEFPQDYFPGVEVTGTRLNSVDNQGLMIGTFTLKNGNSYPFLCWYGCFSPADMLAGREVFVQRISPGVALGAWGWVWPLGGIPHPVPPPLPFLASTPGGRAMLGLAINDLLEGLEDPSTRRLIQESLLEYVIREVRALSKADGQRRTVRATARTGGRSGGPRS
jgi:hypothetical protein